MDGTTKQLSSATIADLHKNFVEYYEKERLNRKEYVNLSNTLVAWAVRNDR